MAADKMEVSPLRKGCKSWRKKLFPALTGRRADRTFPWPEIGFGPTAPNPGSRARSQTRSEAKTA